MCDKCVNNGDIIIMFLLILTIATVIAYFQDYKEIFIGSLSATIAIAIYYYQTINIQNNSKEHLETLESIDNKMVQTDDILNYNYDNNRFSEYDNISMNRDIDSMKQRKVSLDLTVSDDPIDNSDTVESAINKHSSNYQPNRSDGFSSTNSAFLSALSEPNPNTSKLVYNVPLNDSAYDLDEYLSKGQQYRGSINKRAIDGAVRHTRNSFKKVFSNELDENEKRVWYSAEAEDLETDFRPYY